MKYRTSNLRKARDRKSRQTLDSKDTPLTFLSDKNEVDTHIHRSAQCSNERRRRSKGRDRSKTSSTKESRYQSGKLRKLSFLEL